MLLVALVLLLVFIAASLHVAVALGLLGSVLAELYSPFPVFRALGELAWSSSTNFLLLAVPLFIMMGELLLRSGLTEKMYECLDAWVGRIPGGLMHTNVAASAVFAATSGSSLATAATIGTVSIPNMRTHGYNPALFLGSIAAGGTLGILIPPSINMILYGSLSDTSVSALYLASFIPGFLLAASFSVIIAFICMMKPAFGGTPIRAYSWKERIHSLIHLGPPLLLFLLVVGSIYAGLATPTEAASLGVVATLIFTFMRGRLSIDVLLRTFEATVKTTSMILLIVVAALFLNFVLSTLGLTNVIVQSVAGLEWPPLGVLMAIIALYLVLGCFIETITLMIATTPLVVPVIKSIGYDPIWFGVVFVILIEAALITAPIGMNLFVVQTIRGEGPFRDVMLGSLPFLLMMFVMIGFLILFPDLALLMPRLFNTG
ncbi:TRAP transporter large permease [Castellaniella sp.]|uniref:TRAP transporter large permease n=1 Tax=Castellaniella sp. TaxID=1955812 RepID=UPI00355D5554